MMEEGGTINRARGDGILCTSGGDGLTLEGRKDNSFILIGVKANGFCMSGRRKEELRMTLRFLA